MTESLMCILARSTRILLQQYVQDCVCTWKKKHIATVLNFVIIIIKVCSHFYIKYIQTDLMSSTKEVLCHTFLRYLLKNTEEMGRILQQLPQLTIKALQD